MQVYSTKLNITKEEFEQLSYDEQVKLAESWFVSTSGGVVEYVGPEALEDIAYKLFLD